MGAAKRLWEQTALDHFGAVTPETLERARPIAEALLARCRHCTVEDMNCWSCRRALATTDDTVVDRHEEKLIERHEAGLDPAGEVPDTVIDHHEERLIEVRG